MPCFVKIEKYNTIPPKIKGIVMIREEYDLLQKEAVALNLELQASMSSESTSRHIAAYKNALPDEINEVIAARLVCQSEADVAKALFVLKMLRDQGVASIWPEIKEEVKFLIRRKYGTIITEDLIDLGQQSPINLEYLKLVLANRLTKTTLTVSVIERLLSLILRVESRMDTSLDIFLAENPTHASFKTYLSLQQSLESKYGPSISERLMDLGGNMDKFLDSAQELMGILSPSFSLPSHSMFSDRNPAPTRSSGQQLRRAAASGDTANVIAIFEQCPELINDTSASDGRTPLHWAVDKKQFRCVEALLDYHAAYDIKDKKLQTAIDLCLAQSDLMMKNIFVRALQAKFARENSTPEKALRNAANRGDLEAVKLFVSSGVAIDAQSESTKQTALHHAIKNNHIPVISYLITQAASLNLEDSFGQNAYGYGKDKPEVLMLFEMYEKSQEQMRI